MNEQDINDRLREIENEAVAIRLILGLTIVLLLGHVLSGGCR